MPSPRTTNHRAAHAAAITVIRTYEPDPARCVAALLVVLGHQSEAAGNKAVAGTPAGRATAEITKEEHEHA